MIRYLALALSGTAVATAAVVALWSFKADARPTRTPQPEALALKPLGPEARSSQQRLSQGLEAMTGLAALSQPVKVVTAPPIALPQPGTAVAGSVQMPTRSMQLFLESLAEDRNIVAIDERLVQVGSRLPEQGRVKAIQPYRVSITEVQGRQSLDLNVERLAVGTLRWSDGTPASIATQTFQKPAMKAADQPSSGGRP
jgi:hypothetical protein